MDNDLVFALPTGVGVVRERLAEAAIAVASTVRCGGGSGAIFSGL